MRFISYEQARPLIADGDIIFFEGDRSKLAQAIIMFFTKSKVYHTGIAFWIGEGENRRCMLVEAHGQSKRRIVSLSLYEDCGMIVMPAPAPWTEVQGKAFSKVAKRKYGYLEAFYIGLRETLLKYFDIKIPAMDLPAEVCSEFVAKVYDMEPANISPQLLYEYLLLDYKEKG